ncbi:hypothetical protein RND71_019610 [Anisodus tanguticus]|uniref:Uncharacterized protein n=1 Tax=Anisodus tanguticus TaxID=243964 RepID=A0AAE1RZB1_9SOLA|nr:hypothetical protein RND71_019610 [Anisodus tanguticus]
MERNKPQVYGQNANRGRSTGNNIGIRERLPPRKTGQGYNTYTVSRGDSSRMMNRLKSQMVAYLDSRKSTSVEQEITKNIPHLLFVPLTRQGPQIAGNPYRLKKKYKLQYAGLQWHQVRNTGCWLRNNTTNKSAETPRTGGWTQMGSPRPTGICTFKIDPHGPKRLISTPPTKDTSRSNEQLDRSFFLIPAKFLDIYEMLSPSHEPNNRESEERE